MNQMINNIWLAWKLTCMLRTYKICNPMVGFSKYNFNKLLTGETCHRVTLGVIFKTFFGMQLNTQKYFVFGKHFTSSLTHT